MRNTAILASIAIIVCSLPAYAEVAGEMYPSPDKSRELRVVRTSEAPDLAVRLLQDHKEIWAKNLGTNPHDQVLVTWQPDSTSLMIEHINTNKESRLLDVQIVKDTVQVTEKASSAPTVSDKEYAQVSKRILDRIMALKDSFPSMSNMTSAASYEYNTTWVLDDPTKPHSKTNGRREVFGKDAYWFSLQFYRGKWEGAADFIPIEFGDLKLWFQYGHGGNTKEIAAISSIINEEHEAFVKATKLLECPISIGSRFSRELAALKGKTKKEVAVILGQPTKQIESKRHQYWQYDGANRVIVLQFAPQNPDLVNSFGVGATAEEAYMPFTQWIVYPYMTEDKAQSVGVAWMQKTYGSGPDSRTHAPYMTRDMGSYWLVSASTAEGTGDGIAVRVDKKTGTVELNAASEKK